MTDEEVLEMFNFLGHASTLVVLNTAAVTTLACMLGHWPLPPEQPAVGCEPAEVLS